LNKVSIIIPLYNSANYISETVTSALAQTWKNFEIIIVDDGSTDNSYSLAKSFESHILKVYRQEHKGACAARNLAYSKSSGDYVQYLDADDLLSPEKIEQQIKLICDENYIVSTCNSLRFQKNIDKYINTGLSVSKNYVTPIEYILDVWETDDYLCLHAWLFPRTLIDLAGPWDISLQRFQDPEFISRVLISTKEIRFSATGKAFYRDTLNSLSKGKIVDIERSRFHFLQTVIDNILLPIENERTKNAIAFRLSNAIYLWYPEFPDLVGSGLEILKKVNRPIEDNIKGKSIFFLKLFGWRIIRRVEFKISNWLKKLKILKRKIRKHLL